MAWLFFRIGTVPGFSLLKLREDRQCDIPGITYLSTRSRTGLRCRGSPGEAVGMDR